MLVFGHNFVINVLNEWIINLCIYFNNIFWQYNFIFIFYNLNYILDNIFIKLLKEKTNIDDDFIDTFFKKFKIGGELDYDILDTYYKRSFSKKMIFL